MRMESSHGCSIPTGTKSNCGSRCGGAKKTLELAKLQPTSKSVGPPADQNCCCSSTRRRHPANRCSVLPLVLRQERRYCGACRSERGKHVDRSDGTPARHARTSHAQDCRP